MFLNYYLTSGLTRQQNLGNTKASRLPRCPGPQGNRRDARLTGTYTTGMGHRSPRPNLSPAELPTTLRVLSWLFTPPPPGHLALPHLLLTVCCQSLPPCCPSTHVCSVGRRWVRGTRDPTATESLPGPHWPPHAHPLSGKAGQPACLCLPLPAQMPSLAVPADTPRRTGLLMSGKPLVSRLSLNRLLRFPPFLNECLGHFGQCRERKCP